MVIVRAASRPQAATLSVESFGTQSSSKFQHFTFFGQKLADETICSTHLSSNFITIIVAERWFLKYVRVYNYCCVVFVYTVLRK